MIHYHGTPICPDVAAAEILRGRHAMVSFANMQQIDLVADACQSFALDNGAFTAWRAGKGPIDRKQYYDVVRLWMKHPNFDFALIPDIIDATEKDNDVEIAIWPLGNAFGCPIWHLHESLDKLGRLCELFPRVAIGSSGEYATIGTERWWHRMNDAMNVACPYGYPLARLHGLRMLDPAIFTKFPFSSADSTNVARNIGIDKSWRGAYTPANKAGRGMIMAGRIEAFNSAARWTSIETQHGLFPHVEIGIEA